MTEREVSKMIIGHLAEIEKIFDRIIEEMINETDDDAEECLDCLDDARQQVWRQIEELFKGLKKAGVVTAIPPVLQKMHHGAEPELRTAPPKFQLLLLPGGKDGGQ